MPTETEKPIKRAKAPAKKAAPKKKAVETPVAPETATVVPPTDKAGLPAGEAGPAGHVTTAIGRRKTSIASVRIAPGKAGAITVNGKPFESYFTTYELRGILTNPLKMVGMESAVIVDANVHGGGIRGQAEAVRLGLCRALVEWNAAYRKTLKKLGYLTRDPRAKERKKFGLKRARRAPQWSKR